jgi:hypothetical protein
MKKIEITLSLILLFFVGLLSANAGGKCTLKCDSSGKTISVEPCDACEFGDDYIDCDGKYTYCPS